MKKNLALILLALLVLRVVAIKPNRSLVDDPKIETFKLRVAFVVDKDATVPEHFADTVKKAQELLSKVFSSEEFREIMYKQSYNDSAYSKSSKGCFEVAYDPQTGRIPGKVVYENLLKDKSANLLITIKNNGDKKGTMGSSNACVDKITTYDYWLVEKGQLAQRLARHIAHEFTHIKGYRHDNKVPKNYKWGRKLNEDPAYGVGSIVGDILQKWSDKGLL